MTRKQLADKIYRANKALDRAKRYLTNNEYEYAHKMFSRTTTAIYHTDPDYVKAFSLKGVTDEKKLRQIEQGAEKILNSAYFNHNKYTHMKAKQIKSLMDRFSTLEDVVNSKTGEVMYTYDEYGNKRKRKKKVYKYSKEEASRIVDLFQTDIWHHLIENEILASDQIIDALRDGNWVDSSESLDNAVKLLGIVEDVASVNKVSVDVALRSVLTGNIRTEIDRGDLLV
jgi:hypothetical protein